MKSLLLAAVSVFALSAGAAEIKGGSVNVAKGVIELQVAYGGGCEKHEFSLKIGMCLESFPVQCGAELVENTNGDTCEAYIHQTIEISLKDAGLTDSYFKRASLRIDGDNKSSVTLRLP